MIKFNGTLNRSAYWKIILMSLAGFVLISGTLLWLLDWQNAELPGASTFNITLAIIFFVLFSVSVIYFTLMVIGAVMRRAHDTKNSMLWLLLGLFLPFGYLIIGLVPSKK